MTKAIPTLPPMLRSRLYIDVACPIFSRGMWESVSVVRGMNDSPMPSPRVTRGSTKVQKSACRLNCDISQVVMEQMTIPTPRIFFGFTFWTSLPTIGMTQRVASPPGPRTSPAS